MKRMVPSGPQKSFKRLLGIIVTSFADQTEKNPVAFWVV